MNEINRILLIRFGSIGDVVLTLPVVNALREAFPKAYIAMLVGDRSADIVSNDKRLDEVIVFRRNMRGFDGISEMRRIKAIIRGKGFDLSIDMQRKFRSSLISYQGGIRYRIGYHQPGGFLCNIRIPDKDNKHAIDRNLDLLIPLGISGSDRVPRMCLADEDRKYADQVFDAKGVTGSSVIGMFVGAGWRQRCWAAERFAAIGDRAVSEYNANIVIFGGTGEEDIVDSVAQEMRSKAILMKEKVTLRQLAAMIEKCDVFISNDTGPMHISVAVDTPTIALFGPGNYIKFQPVGIKHLTITKNVPCSPCKQFTDKCKDNICMKAITVDEVWKAVQSRMRNENYIE